MSQTERPYSSRYSSCYYGGQCLSNITHIVVMEDTVSQTLPILLLLGILSLRHPTRDTAVLRNNIMRPLLSMVVQGICGKIAWASKHTLESK